MGAWDVGMQANDSALDAIGDLVWFENNKVYPTEGRLQKYKERSIRALEEVEGEPFKALENAYKRYSAHGLLGLAEKLLELGIDIGPESKNLVLRILKSELDISELSTWCDPYDRKEALLNFEKVVKGENCTDFENLIPH